MSKTKVIALALLISLGFAPHAMARTKSFNTALDAVRTFDKETKALLPDTMLKEHKKVFIKTIKENNVDALSAIRSLRRSEGPSPKRFKRLYKIVKDHTRDHIKEVDKLASKVSPKNKREIKKLSARLLEMRTAFLEELKGTSSSERVPAKGIKADPVLDRSPYEERPGDNKGLFER
jgi:hypothetical protein